MMGLAMDFGVEGYLKPGDDNDYDYRTEPHL